MPGVNFESVKKLDILLRSRPTETLQKYLEDVCASYKRVLSAIVRWIGQCGGVELDICMRSRPI